MDHTFSILRLALAEIEDAAFMTTNMDGQVDQNVNNLIYIYIYIHRVQI